MSTVLGTILVNFLASCVRKRIKVWKMAIIILTNGRWRRMQSDFAVSEKVVESSQKLKQALPNAPDEDVYYLRIHFVRFGHDLSFTVLP